MSGPLLAALVATVVAVVALAGVAVLVLQVRRLRAEVGANVAAADPALAAPASDTAVPSAPVPATEPTEPGPPGSPAVDGPADLPALLHDSGPAPVFELLPMGQADAGGEPPSQQQILAATLTHPLVRVSALSYGIRRALRAENRDRLAALVRRDLRRRHKVRRRAARRAARVVPIRPADDAGARDDREESAS